MQTHTQTHNDGLSRPFGNRRGQQQRDRQRTGEKGGSCVVEDMCDGLTNIWLKSKRVIYEKHDKGQVALNNYRMEYLLSRCFKKMCRHFKLFYFILIRMHKTAKER